MCSTNKDINRVQYEQDPVGGQKLVLSQLYKPITNITKYHHFRMEEASPGTVFVRELPESEEAALTVVKRGQDARGLGVDTLPATVAPAGLSAARQWYLYSEIRQYCQEEFKDFTAPLPQVPKPRSSVIREETEEMHNRRRLT